MKSLVTTTAALTISLGMLSGNASAGHRETIHDLAYTLKRQTTRAAREVRYGFRHTPQYRHLYKDVYEMYREADHLYRISHHAVSNAHVLEDIEELDELMHHTQELVAEIKKHTGSPLDHDFGHGAASRYHLRRLCDILESTNHTLHELQDLVDYKSPNRLERELIPPAAPSELPPIPSARRRRIEVFRSGRGGFGFSLRIR